MVIPFGQPWITEEDRLAVDAALQRPILTHGPETEEFEREFSSFLGDAAHCVTVSSCMAALHLAYLSLDIGPGDEVIVPAQTHVATAHAVEIVGARPVFVDCELTTGNVFLEEIESALTRRTKAISVVHFLGIPVNMPRLADLAKRHGIYVVEDCALALGSRYEAKHVGLFGDVGCFSFYPIKHITCGEGGMFVSKHPELASKARLLRSFGTERSPSTCSKYDVSVLGLNYRLSEIGAALGRSQLRRIDTNLCRRARNFRVLRDLISGIPPISILDVQQNAMLSAYYCQQVLLQPPLAEKRDTIATQLRTMGVGTSTYYPHPVPRLKFYRAKYGWNSDRFPNAQRISDCSVALPIGPTLSESDIRYVGESFVAACNLWTH